MANKRILDRLIEERNYVILGIMEAQMVGSENRERYWRHCFDQVTGEIDEECRRLGLPRIDVIQLPLWVFLDGGMTNVTCKW